MELFFSNSQWVFGNGTFFSNSQWVFGNGTFFFNSQWVFGNGTFFSNSQWVFGNGTFFFSNSQWVFGNRTFFFQFSRNLENAYWKTQDGDAVKEFWVCRLWDSSLPSLSAAPNTAKGKMAKNLQLTVTGTGEELFLSSLDVDVQCNSFLSGTHEMTWPYACLVELVLESRN